MHNAVVSDVSYAEGVMRGEVLGVERRRRWSDEDKLSIVSSVGIDGATVTQVAHRFDVTRQQIYRWRHELKKKGLWPPDEGTIFLPIDFQVADAAPDPKPAPAVRLELRLQSGRSLRFDSTMDEAVLTRLIRAVEAA
ncbi:MAG: transposase [Paracoccaceae bacterium]